MREEMAPLRKGRTQLRDERTLVRRAGIPKKGKWRGSCVGKGEGYLLGYIIRGMQ